MLRLFQRMKLVAKQKFRLEYIASRLGYRIIVVTALFAQGSLNAKCLNDLINAFILEFDSSICMKNADLI